MKVNDTVNGRRGEGEVNHIVSGKKSLCVESDLRRNESMKGTITI